jgi:hypothetical protein
MPLLFSYGTLQQDDIQLATFGRLLKGRRDELVGFVPALVRIEPPEVAARLGKTHHNDARRTTDASNRVAGMVFEVTNEELARCDDYEAEFHYDRVMAPLASGEEAWVYVHVERSPA